MSARVRVNAKPGCFEFALQRTALLVIDMQRDFCCPGGFGEALGNDISNVRTIIPVVAHVLSACRSAEVAIIHTREGHRPDLVDCPASKIKRSRVHGLGIGDEGPMGRILVRGAYGHDFVDELVPLANEVVVDKPGKGAFYQTDLAQRLEQGNIESLILTGVTTHVCVHSTLREANDRGYECLVVEDATAAYDTVDHDAAIRMIHQQGGIFGWTTTAAELTDVLAQSRL